jgi:hypothetical protein
MWANKAGYNFWRKLCIATFQQKLLQKIVHGVFCEFLAKLKAITFQGSYLFLIQNENEFSNTFASMTRLSRKPGNIPQGVSLTIFKRRIQE